VLDGAIVNIALPSMGRYFQRSQTDMTWAVNAYTLTFGGLLLLGGRSGDIFGRRRMLTIGLGLFSVGSLAAGLATTFELLLAGRAVQGVGAAIASPIALSLITTEWQEGPARNRAIGVYATISGAGAVVGLLLGGVLTEYLSWRWVLFVNVPIGFGLLVATRYFISESQRTYARIDAVGAGLSVAGLTGLVYGFIHAGNDGWSNALTIVILGLSVAVLAGFGWYEARGAPQPMLPLQILRDRNRSGAYLVILVVGASLFGILYFITFCLQGMLDYSALKAGFAFLPAAAVLAVSTQLSAQLMPKFGPKPLVLFGTVLLTVALGWLSRIGADSSYLNPLLPAMVIAAIGLGAVLVPLTVIVMSRVGQPDAALASAVLNVGQQLGGSVGLAVVASAAATAGTTATKTQVTALLKQYGLSAHLGNFAVLGQSLQKGTPPPPGALRDGIARHALNSVQAHAYGAGFQTAAIFGAIAVLITLVVITTKKAEVVSTR
jgi:EmrB/QacA subfamily drug resistance transporter